VVIAVVETHPGHRRLVISLLGAPVAWLLHLGTSYFLVALGCGTGWQGAGLAVLLITGVCTALAAWAGWLAWIDWRRARQAPSELDPPTVRGFVGALGVISAGLFCGAILIAGIAPLFLPMCG
jgi:hypothetical protein